MLFWCRILQCNLKHSIYCICSSVYYISSRICYWMSFLVNFLIPCIAGLLNEVLFYNSSQNIYIRHWSCYISNLFVCLPVNFNIQLRCCLEHKQGWLYTGKQQKNLTFSIAVSDCFYRRQVQRSNMWVSISVKFCKMCVGAYDRKYAVIKHLAESIFSSYSYNTLLVDSKSLLNLAI